MFCPDMKGTGTQAPGGHAEYMLMNADATYLIPDNVSYEQAAPIFCAGYTVYSGLRWADPQPHECVAVLGIGGLGHLAVQYAKAAGFETFAVSHSPDKDKMIRELGADEVVRDGRSLAAAGGADVILGTSNSTKSMVDSIQGLRPDGRLVAMGADAEPLSVSLMDLISKRIRVIGSQENGPEYLYEALDFVAKGKVRTIRRDVPVDRGSEGVSTRRRGQAPVPRRPHNERDTRIRRAILNFIRLLPDCRPSVRNRWIRSGARTPRSADNSAYRLLLHLPYRSCQHCVVCNVRIELQKEFLVFRIRNGFFVRGTGERRDGLK